MVERGSGARHLAGFLDALDEQGLLDWDEVFVDASFSPAKKRGDCVGKTRRGKGTKWLVVADGQGIPLACGTESASPAEVTLVEGVLEEVPLGNDPTPLIADRAYHSDLLRTSLQTKGWDLVCPHRKGRVRPATQDGRKLRRYRRRRKIERTSSWIGSFRRLVVRHEYYSFIYQGFLHLACILICLRRF